MIIIFFISCRLKAKQDKLEDARLRRQMCSPQYLPHSSLEEEMDEFRKQMGTSMAIIAEDHEVKQTGASEEF